MTKKNIYYIIIPENKKKEVVKMKVEKVIKRNGQEEVEVLTGRDWQGKRFYLDKPKGAFVDYKKGTYHKSNYDRVGTPLNEWRRIIVNLISYDEMFRLVED